VKTTVVFTHGDRMTAIQFPLQITNRRWIYAVIECPGFRKFLDQDEFFYAYAVLTYIAERKKVDSNAQIARYLKEIQTNVFEGAFAKYRSFDSYSKMYCYLLAQDGLITFEEVPDVHVGTQTRCIICITKKGVDWLEQQHDLAEKAKTLKLRLKKQEGEKRG